MEARVKETATGHYAQGPIMADPSMVENLHHQAQVIWPQECILFERLELHNAKKVADLGCGTGEISGRLAQTYSFDELFAIDLIENVVSIARQRHGHLPNLHFKVGNAKETGQPDDHFDLPLCRHVLQAIPEPGELIDEMIRITRPGGTLYFLAEDYGMIHATNEDVEPIWTKIANVMLSQGSDLHIGRKLPVLLKQKGFENIEIHYLRIDNINSDRNHLAGVFEAWRDGYVNFIAEHAGYSPGEATDFLNAHAEAALSEDEYLLWIIPIITARVP